MCSLDAALASAGLLVSCDLLSFRASLASLRVSATSPSILLLGSGERPMAVAALCAEGGRGIAVGALGSDARFAAVDDEEGAGLIAGAEAV